jgi:hypothetical protein
VSLLHPILYYSTFESVFNYLFIDCRVASHHGENKMNPVSLGLVFAPLLFRKQGSEDVPYADEVVEWMIEYADDVFGEGESEDSQKS